MENSDTKVEARILRGEQQGDYPDDTSDVRCPVCGKVNPIEYTFTFYCEGREDDVIELCENCKEEFEHEHELDLPLADVIGATMFELMWVWAPRARAEGLPWELNDQLLNDLQLIKARTGAKDVRVVWQDDTLTVGSGNQSYTFSWQALTQYRGDALFDVILNAFKREEPRT